MDVSICGKASYGATGQFSLWSKYVSLRNKVVSTVVQVQRTDNQRNKHLKRVSNLGS